MEILFPLSWYRSNDFHAVFCCFDCWNRLKKSRCCNQSSCSRPFPGSGSKSLIQFSEQPGHPPLKIQTPWSGQQSWRFIPKLTRKSLANFFWFLRMFRTSAAFFGGIGNPDPSQSWLPSPAPSMSWYNFTHHQIILLKWSRQYVATCPYLNDNCYSYAFSHHHFSESTCCFLVSLTRTRPSCSRSETKRCLGTRYPAAEGIVGV